ncbi:MAG: 16S rRNA (cytosine(1402)-N(4))-methyltransferase RsmH [Bacteroidaceae bacterium]|nr:16S rRNA (cytosine(1402)-N(4))-methyltransferase RsmH [Bacteroidaceae bacterium]
MDSSVYHIPVLLSPSVEGLNIKEQGIYVDVTLGGGGHSREILRRLGSEGHLFSFDQDQDAIERSMADNTQNGRPLSDGGKWTLVRSNFRYLKNWMRYYAIDGIDGLLADLGVSSHHFDEGGRGFSFRTDAPLDMRMNQQARQTAAEIIQTYTEPQLADVFRLYGELHQAKRIAAAIVKARAQEEIHTTAQLADLLTPLLGRDREKKDLARAFQALRIEVNHEMDALRDMLTAATELLLPGGRLVVISYHSLEDRIVKNLMRAGNIEGDIRQDIYGRSESPLRPIGKPVTPSDEELAQNPRSRSAKLRIAEKMG